MGVDCGAGDSDGSALKIAAKWHSTGGSDIGTLE